MDHHSRYLTPTPMAIAALAAKRPNAIAIDSISTNEQLTWKEMAEVDDFKRRFGVNVYTTFGSTGVLAVFSCRETEVHSSNWRSCGRKTTFDRVRAGI